EQTDSARTQARKNEIPVEAAEVPLLAGQQHPAARKQVRMTARVPSLVVIAFAQHRRQIQIVRQVAENGLKVKIAIRDVDYDDAAGRQFFEVHLDRFLGQQVDRNRIGAEGVHENQVIRPIRGVLL